MSYILHCAILRITIVCYVEDALPTPTFCYVVTMTSDSVALCFDQAMFSMKEILACENYKAP